MKKLIGTAAVSFLYWLLVFFIAADWQFWAWDIEGRAFSAILYLAVVFLSLTCPYWEDVSND